MKISFTFFLIILLSNQIYSQDIFVGDWKINSVTTENLHQFEARLEIGQSEKGILYPAQLTISIDSFHASYQLLLAKKNSRQLVISTQKYALTEVPFKLGKWMQLLNGTLDFSRDLKGQPTLSLNRISLDGRTSLLKIRDWKSFPENEKSLAKKIVSILENAEIQFIKTSNEAWKDQAAKTIVQPKISSIYFGVMDTLFVKNKIGTIEFKGNHDNDIVSVKNNNNGILDQIDSKKKRDEEDFILDTGLNILTFFADDFGKKGFSSAAINLKFENTNKLLDFTDSSNLAATFIAVKIYNPFDEEANKKFETFIEKENNVVNYPKPSNIPTGNNKNNNGLGREGKLVGTLVSKSKELEFSLWDDAVEDGDSISLSINGKWIAKGFPVKKKPQTIKVTLAPGYNLITFVADNLGSISPNTTVLEIIDGNKRMPFFIETDFKLNNLVKIYYKVNQ
jgi:hypothetical protein